jgi:hypothetical protein
MKRREAARNPKSPQGYQDGKRAFVDELRKTVWAWTAMTRAMNDRPFEQAQITRIPSGSAHIRNRTRTAHRALRLSDFVGVIWVSPVRVAAWAAPRDQQKSFKFRAAGGS